MIKTDPYILYPTFGSYFWCKIDRQCWLQRVPLLFKAASGYELCCIIFRTNSGWSYRMFCLVCRSSAAFSDDCTSVQTGKLLERLNNINGEIESTEDHGN